ncbi:unnamed protein product [Periconia digitata]|uniref:Uncharacterized protein n=1 Tax=Periconia digitata TaxID=1303443 RepID=A0A9W4XYG8_9PLEO|nr:unnamed protein product [Periconia digitata]
MSECHSITPHHSTPPPHTACPSPTPTLGKETSSGHEPSPLTCRILQTRSRDFLGTPELGVASDCAHNHRSTSSWPASLLARLSGTRGGHIIDTGTPIAFHSQFFKYPNTRTLCVCVYCLALRFSWPRAHPHSERATWDHPNSE